MILILKIYTVGGHPCTFIQVYIEEKTWRVQFFITSCFLSPIHTPYPSRVYSTQFNISSAELTQYLALQMAGSYAIPLKWWRTIWYRNLYFASFEPHMKNTKMYTVLTDTRVFYKLLYRQWRGRSPTRGITTGEGQ